MMDAKVHVLIVAAGIGSRFQSHDGLPKQYHHIGEKTVLAHSIEAFNDIKCAAITVVKHPEDHWWSDQSFRSNHTVFTCTGGNTRSQSVINGLEAIQADHQADHQDWVLVHDAARPCLNTNDIEYLMAATCKHDVGGLLVKPISDTIKKTHDGQHSQQTIDRNQLFAALTPQMFRLGDLLQCMKQANEALTTDESSAFEQAGQQPLLVQGSSHNIKITYPEDLALAHFYLQQQGRL